MPYFWIDAVLFYVVAAVLFRRGKRDFRAYSFWAIHVFIASSTALDKSPFFPPNLSTVCNLSCFSNSFGRSTVIRPIFNHQHSFFVVRFHVSSVLPISELPDSEFYFCLSYHFSFTFSAYWLIDIIYYVLTHLYRYWLNLILAERSQMNQTSETPETRQREPPNDLNIMMQEVGFEPSPCWRYHPQTPFFLLYHEFQLSSFRK